MVNRPILFLPAALGWIGSSFAYPGQPNHDVPPLYCKFEGDTFLEQLKWDPNEDTVYLIDKFVNSFQGKVKYFGQFKPSRHSPQGVVFTFTYPPKNAKDLYEKAIKTLGEMGEIDVEMVLSYSSSLEQMEKAEERLKESALTPEKKNWDYDAAIAIYTTIDGARILIEVVNEKLKCSRMKLWIGARPKKKP